MAQDTNTEFTTTEEGIAPIGEWDEWAGDTAVIIGCSDAKADTECAAAEMYRSSFFTLALKAARALVPDEDIRILSACHGLLTLDEVIDPYNVRWGSDDAIDAEDLDLQLGFLAATHSTIVALTTNAYTTRITSATEAVAALAGGRGIGDHRHHLAGAARLVDATR